MTDEGVAALEEIRQRADAATAGPWWFDESDLCWRLHGVASIIPAQLFPDGEVAIPEQVVNHQILKAQKCNTRMAEYWPNEADGAFIVAARTDVPRLVAALDAVLRHHQPRQLYGFIADENHPGRCPHDPDRDWDQHFEDDGMWYCRDKPTIEVCTSCTDESDGDLWAEWPCPTYKDIATALLGEAKPDA